jgi:hypothetical protein
MSRREATRLEDCEDWDDCDVFAERQRSGLALTHETVGESELGGPEWPVVPVAASAPSLYNPAGNSAADGPRAFIDRLLAGLAHAAP